MRCLKCSVLLSICCCFSGYSSCKLQMWHTVIEKSGYKHTHGALQHCISGLVSQSEVTGCSRASVCVLFSLHSSGLSGQWCWLRLSNQVSLLPHGRPIHYSQSWEKSGRKIRNHRPTELGSIDCTFLFRSTRWPVAVWLAQWRTALYNVWQIHWWTFALN